MAAVDGLAPAGSGPKITFWYPSVPQGISRAVRYRARGWNPQPAIARADFHAALRRAAAEGVAIVGDAVETFGRNAGAFREARRAAEAIGIPLFLRAELEEERMRQMLASAPFQHLLTQIPASYRLRFHPISQVPTDEVPRASLVERVGPGSYRVYVMEDSHSSVIGHELMHVLMDAEGYPRFEGHDCGIWDSMLSDVEVERRLDELGFGTKERLSARATELARTGLGRMPLPWATTMYVTYALYPLSRPLVRDALLARIERDEREAAALARHVLPLLDQGRALRGAGSAAETYERVAALLHQEGLSSLRVVRGDLP